MARLGRKPIEIPSGVAVQLAGGILHFKGSKGDLDLPVLPFIGVDLAGNQLAFKTLINSKQALANQGTMAALTKNAIVGVSGGFSKTLQMLGVGFRASLEGKTLVLNVGFSHPVKFEPPAGITIELDKSGTIKISGMDRGLVGQAAAQIRKIKPPEPYKGKGIRYEGEIVRKKAGKKAVSATA